MLHTQESHCTLCQRVCLTTVHVKLTKTAISVSMLGLKRRIFLKFIFFVAVRYFEHKALPQISDKHIVSLSKLLIHILSLEGDDLSFLCSQLVPADSQ